MESTCFMGKEKEKKHVGGEKKKKKNFVRLQPRDSNSRPSRFPLFPQYINALS